MFVHSAWAAAWAESSARSNKIVSRLLLLAHGANERPPRHAAVHGCRLLGVESDSSHGERVGVTMAQANAACKGKNDTLRLLQG